MSRKLHLQISDIINELLDVLDADIMTVDDHVRNFASISLYFTSLFMVQRQVLHADFWIGWSSLDNHFDGAILLQI